MTACNNFVLILMGASMILVTQARISIFRNDIVTAALDQLSDEPDHTKYAEVARYVVHKSDWASFGTISTLKSIEGFPMVNVISVADSARGAPSTGNIYFYLTNLDYTAKDLIKANKLTVLFSNDQDLACTKRNIDPMEPTCARVILSGNIEKLDTDTEEFKFANSSFIDRHPAATHWIATHAFFLCKLNIVQIGVLDWYGGPHYVTPTDYYNADVNLNFELKGLINKSLLKENNFSLTEQYLYKLFRGNIIDDDAAAEEYSRE